MQNILMFDNAMILTLSTLGKISADDVLKYFSQKIDFDISCKLSPMETICRKCQNLLSDKNKKNILKRRLLN